jgi:hypothetical protein
LRPPSMPAVMWSLAAHHHDTVTARSGDAGNWSKEATRGDSAITSRPIGGEQAANPLQPVDSSRHTTTANAKVAGTITASPLVTIWRCLRSHGRGHGLHLVLARKTVSAAHRCNRTMTCRSALDTDAAYGRQPLLYSAPSLLESSWWPAVPRIRLLPRRQVQPGRLPRVRR